MSENQEFLTVREAAAFLRVTRITLQNWRDSGEGPPWVRLGPKTIRYRLSSLMSYLDDIESV